LAGAPAGAPWIPPAPPPGGRALSEEARRLLAQSRRPLALVGLGARTAAVHQLGIPTLVTYKAKGVMPECDPWFAGIVTNGPRDREIMDPRRPLRGNRIRLRRADAGSVEILPARGVGRRGVGRRGARVPAGDGVVAVASPQHRQRAP
jgi:hypothetical protein